MQFGLFEEQPAQFSTLGHLIAHMLEMTDDPLYPTGSNMVIYRGNPDARLMIVGEAPGPQEDRLGQPFVGKAGKMLDQILDAAGFDSEKDVFITNTVFRLPPGEGGKSFRKPTREEIDAYRPYIHEIIRLVDPIIMVLTGNVATESLLKQTGITKLRGNWQNWHGRWVMPMFHPSYLLRNPSRTPGSPKAQTWDDIQEVRRKYDELLLPSG